MAKARDGSDNKVEGMETVGNSLERAPWGRSEMEATRGWTDRKTVGNTLLKVLWGRSEMEATTGWTDGKPWEIARGELREKERD